MVEGCTIQDAITVINLQYLKEKRPSFIARMGRIYRAAHQYGMSEYIALLICQEMPAFVAVSSLSARTDAGNVAMRCRLSRVRATVIRSAGLRASGMRLNYQCDMSREQNSTR